VSGKFTTVANFAGSLSTEGRKFAVALAMCVTLVVVGLIVAAVLLVPALARLVGAAVLVAIVLAVAARAEPRRTEPQPQLSHPQTWPKHPWSGNDYVRMCEGDDMQVFTCYVWTRGIADAVAAEKDRILCIPAERRSN
jgi:hypothetical protein